MAAKNQRIKFFYIIKLYRKKNNGIIYWKSISNSENVQVQYEYVYKCVCVCVCKIACAVLSVWYILLNKHNI